MADTKKEAARYIVERRDGDGMSLTPGRPVIEKTVRFIVRWSEDDKLTAWFGNSYFARDMEGRRLNGLRLAAVNMAKRYQAHFDRTGKRFEVEQKEKRDAEQAEKKRLSAIKRKKMDAAEHLYAALARIYTVFSSRGEHTKMEKAVLDMAAKALEKADG